MEDSLDLNDITTASFMSPMPAAQNKSFGNESTEGSPYLGDMSSLSDPADYMPPDSPAKIDDSDFGMDDGVQVEHLTAFSADEQDEDEKTVVLPKHASKPVPRSPPQSSSNGEPEPPVPANLSETPNSKHMKVRINSEVERIVVTSLLYKRFPILCIASRKESGPPLVILSCQGILLRLADKV